MSREGRRVAWMILVAMLATGAVMGQEGEWTRSCRFAVQVNGVLDGGMYEQRGTPDLLGRLGDGTWFLLQPVRRQAPELGNHFLRKAMAEMLFGMLSQILEG